MRDTKSFNKIFKQFAKSDNTAYVYFVRKLREGKFLARLFLGNVLVRFSTTQEEHCKERFLTETLFRVLCPRWIQVIMRSSLQNKRRKQMANGEKREFAGWWLWVTLLIIVSTGAFILTGAAGKVFGTAVEREVFEQSYQRSAAQEARYNTMTAELVGVETRLSSGSSLTDVQRADLEAQASALHIQINLMED